MEEMIKCILKEIYFNVYENNVEIINLVRKLGFKTNMTEYHLEFISKELS